mgnify:CR=1 FL=1|jgi:hypothetical protein
MEEINSQLEEFNAEKHVIKAKVKAILIEYCNLEDESYSVEGDQDLDLDDYLNKLELALNSWKSRVIDESKSMFTQRISELED